MSIATEPAAGGRRAPARSRNRAKRARKKGKKGTMTLAEYFETPETTLPQELIYGAMRIADAPFVSHQRVVFRLAMALQRHIEPGNLGEVLLAPTDVILDAERALVLQPDLLFVSRERSSMVRERVDGPPDLVVEVLSPGPRIGALDERVQWFARYGVREIWLCDQARRAMHVLECADGTLRRATLIEAGQPMRSSVLPRLESLGV
jgi:Uma2 family endonuclease